LIAIRDRAALSCGQRKEFRVLVVGKKGETMHSGTLIDQLMATVERTEKRVMQVSSPEDKLTYFYTMAQSELAQFEANLAGVA
jgi:hypothetical protein